MVETREERTLRVADISSGQCVRSNVQTVVEYDVVLPAGTALTQVTVEYWFNGKWVEAMCDYKPEEKKFICQGMYENPLFGDSYNIRTIINDKEYIGTYISLDNKCIFFE